MSLWVDKVGVSSKLHLIAYNSSSIVQNRSQICTTTLTYLLGWALLSVYALIRRVICYLNAFLLHTGRVWGLSSYVVLWAIRGWQKDSHRLYFKGTIWPRRWQGEIIDNYKLCLICFHQLKIDQRVFMTPSRRKLDLNVVQSNYHIEITPRCVFSNNKLHALTFYSDVGTYDRVVIQEILKEIAQTQQVDLSAKQRFKGFLLFFQTY